MSRAHPIISVTGASGSGRGTVREAFRNVFHRQGIRAVFVDGESFHRYDREEMAKARRAAETAAGGCATFSHFGPEANLFEDLETLFRTYGETGTGRHRAYLHSDEDALPHAAQGLRPGQFTPWADIRPGTDVLVYEGLHGAVKTDTVDVSRHVDLRIGVAPIINLEWIQKLHNDTTLRGYSEQAVMDVILRRMHDYVHYVIPQFERSDINFQKVSVVDTSDPIVARDVPSDDECLVVIRFRDPDAHSIDFPYLLRELHDSRMTRRNTIVVPGGKLGLAMELILAPITDRLCAARKAA
ncbi:MAG: phosphoribulokinase [Rhodobacterales bacterium]|nr:phosphoribulokinase [Rhodobacterales bacterium]